jgi:hypothetical protein
MGSEILIDHFYDCGFDYAVFYDGKKGICEYRVSIFVQKKSFYNDSVLVLVYFKLVQLYKTSTKKLFIWLKEQLKNLLLRDLK